ncbi:MAG: DUF4339 domain-containing protein, partial [Pseudomonadota bacterium]
SMGIVGDLGAYTQFSAAEAMSEAASNPAGGGMAAGLGAGMGMAMAGNMMGQSGPWGQAPQAAPQTARQAPPPPPVEKVWHTAKDGKTSGPFSRADLGKRAADGTLTRDTHVWTPGIDGWTHAGEIPELAQLFTVMPPPPPPAA